MSQKGSRELSMGLRLLVLLGMTVLLLIPQALIAFLVSDREDVAEQAMRSVTAPWGGEQTVQGPLLAIPYTVRRGGSGDQDGESYERYAFMQPDSVSITVDLRPEVRHRGVYPVLLYRAHVRVGGRFGRQSLADFPGEAASVRWGEGYLVQPVRDNVGLKSVLRIGIDGEVVPLSAGEFPGDRRRSPILARAFAVDTMRAGYEFSYEYTLNGSESLEFQACRGITHVSARMGWGAPSFTGRYLPDERVVEDTVTRAEWTVLGVNTMRNGSFHLRADGYIDADDFDDSSERFGVRLLAGISHYDMVGRSVRFGVLMIVFTFLTFFFTDSLLKRPIPMIGYVLTGLAILLFYTLLLSISEYLAFGVSFLISSLSITGMVSLYLYGFVRRVRPVLVSGGVLGMLYTFLYIILQMENFPLLVGSIFLFVVLSVVMYLSQRLEW